MKTKIKTLLGCTLLALTFTGCSDDPQYNLNGPVTYGQVSLADMDCEVRPDEITLSRADEIDTSSFLVTIVNAEGEEVYTSTYAERNEIVTLPVASGYRVQICNHPVENVAWESPYYYGETTFEVRENDITDIGTIICKFANIRVSVRYSERLQALMSDDCTVDVECSEFNTKATYTPDETRSAYFRALVNSTTLGATFRGTVKGQRVSLSKSLTNVAAGQHRIITFDVKSFHGDIPEETGGIGMSGVGQGVPLGDGLYLDITTTTEDINGNIVLDEEADQSAQRPGHEEPLTPPTPPGPEDPTGDPVTITSRTLSFTNIMDPADYDVENGGMDAVVNIHCPAGTAHLHVTISSDNNNFILSVNQMNIPLDFDLVNITEGTPEYTNLKNLGFPMNEGLIGDTDPVFDITQFVSLLSAFEGTHTFTLEVEDAAGSKLVKTLTFKVA